MSQLDFGRWVALEDPTDMKADDRCLCKCSCGTAKKVRVADLKAGKSASCGCARREKAHARKQANPVSRTKTYKAWNAMLYRCNKPKCKDFHHYGGRGITVDPRWEVFENFLADMGEQPPGLTLDRIDNNGNYSKDNCRWLSRKEQSRNTRRNKFFMYEGKMRTISEIAELMGASTDALSHRMSAYGWSPERTFSTPVKKVAPRKRNTDLTTATE